MKFSIKRFFVNEGGNYKSSVGGTGGAKSSHGHSSSGGRSSTNVQVNIGEASRRDDDTYADYIRDMERDDRATGNAQKPGGGAIRGSEKYDPARDGTCSYCGEDAYCVCPDGPNSIVDDWAQFGTHIPDMPFNPYKNEANEFQLTAPDYIMLEKKLSSYKHPRTHLAKKFSKQKDAIKEPWALAQVIASKEGAIEEHQDPTQLKDIGSTVWSNPAKKASVKRFTNKDGNLHIDLNEAEESDDPFQREEGDLGDDMSWLDDPNLGAGVELPKYERQPKKDKAPKVKPPAEDSLSADALKPSMRSFFQQIEDEDLWSMSWEDVKAERPKEAEDVESFFPEIGDMKRNFMIDKNGDIIMQSYEGGRLKYDPEQGFIPMDDGQTPAGEF